MSEVRIASGATVAAALQSLYLLALHQRGAGWFASAAEIHARERAQARDSRRSSLLWIREDTRTRTADSGPCQETTE